MSRSAPPVFGGGAELVTRFTHAPIPIHFHAHRLRIVDKAVHPAAGGFHPFCDLLLGQLHKLFEIGVVAIAKILTRTGQRQAVQQLQFGSLRLSKIDRLLKDFFRPRRLIDRHQNFFYRYSLN